MIPPETAHDLRPPRAASLRGSHSSWVRRWLGRGSFDWLGPWLYPAQEYTQRTYSRLLRQHLRPETRWLDAGCGHRISDALSQEAERELIRNAAVAVGCDLDLATLTQHRTLDKRTCNTLTKLPFADARFNLVTLNMVAEHLDQPASVFAELARVLGPDGRIIVHTPNVSSYFMRLVRLGRWVLPDPWVRWLIRYLEGREDEDIFPTHYRANTRRQLATLLAEAKFEEEDVRLLVDRPLLHFFAPLSALEILFVRTLLILKLNTFAAPTILGVYRRKTAPAPSGSETCPGIWS